MLRKTILNYYIQSYFKRMADVFLVQDNVPGHMTEDYLMTKEFRAFHGLCMHHSPSFGPNWLLHFP